MTENEESDNDNNTKSLEEQLKIAKNEKDQAELEYNEIHHKVKNLEEMLDDYQKKLNNHPHKHDRTIALLFLAIMVLIIAITTYNLALSTISLIKLSSYLGGIITFLLIPLTSGLEVKIIKKIQNIAEKLIQNNMKNSEEHQILQIQIETIKEDLKNARIEEFEKNLKKVDTMVKYGGLTSEQKIKASMVNYYPKNIATSEELQNKPYIKKLTK